MPLQSTSTFKPTQITSTLSHDNMPKRKRGDNDHDNSATSNASRVAKMRRKDVEEKIAQSKKQLHRAIKTAKGFERQKLAKRLKQAESGSKLQPKSKVIHAAGSAGGGAALVARIHREIAALKALDLGKATDAHLWKNITKVKAFAESEFLPHEARQWMEKGAAKPDGTEEERTATHNVVSGLYNARCVKEEMGKIINGLYLAFGVQAPAVLKPEKRKRKKDFETGKDDTLSSAGTAETKTTSDKGMQEEEELSWEGFGSEDRAFGHDDSDGEGSVTKKISYDEALDEDDELEFSADSMSRYDALIGDSSDEESFDEDAEEKPTSARILRGPSRSISLSPSPSASSTPSITISLSPETSSTRTKPNAKSGSKKVNATPVDGSMFVPSLMGGYWSGSESGSEDAAIDDPAAVALPRERKNRPGQMARRAIWEKKFGRAANHVAKGLGSMQDRERERMEKKKGREQGNGDGWDSQRGAVGRDRRGRGGTFSSGHQPGRQRNLNAVTGENAVGVGPRSGAGGGKRDDVGTLHPSWQAAKKAKELKKGAEFAGKKVVFD